MENSIQPAATNDQVGTNLVVNVYTMTPAPKKRGVARIAGVGLLGLLVAGMVTYAVQEAAAALESRRD